MASGKVRCCADLFFVEVVGGVVFFECTQCGAKYQIERAAAKVAKSRKSRVLSNKTAAKAELPSRRAKASKTNSKASQRDSKKDQSKVPRKEKNHGR